MKHNLLIAALSTGILWTINGFAVSPGDYFCKEVLQSMPAYYSIAVKDCGDGKTQTIEGVCTQTVTCAYVSEDTKKAAQESTKKEFAQLTDAEKSEFLAGTESVDWFPATLTCRGKKEAVGPICPTPEQCKGDIFFKMQPATMDAAKFQGMIDRLKAAKPLIFQNGLEKPAGAAK
jgi:hypothetical protein